MHFTFCLCVRFGYVYCICVYRCVRRLITASMFKCLSKHVYLFLYQIINTNHKHVYHILSSLPSLTLLKLWILYQNDIEEFEEFEYLSVPLSQRYTCKAHKMNKYPMRYKSKYKPKKVKTQYSNYRLSAAWAG